MAKPVDPYYAQAQALVNAQIGQLIGQTSAAYNTRSKQGRKYITGLSKAFAKELRAIGQGVGGAYDSGERETAAMNNAMSAYLTGQGAQIGGQLGSSLEGLGTPAPQQASAMGASLGIQNMALGNANLARFSREGTSEESYARALPGIAGLSAIQEGRGFEDRMAADLEQAIAAIQGQAPGLTNQLYSAFSGNALDRARLAQDKREFNYQKNQGNEQERLDNAQAFALQLASQANVGIDPTTGAELPDRGESHADIERRVRAFYEGAFPGKPPAWIDQKVQQALSAAGSEYGVADYLPQLQAAAAKAQTFGMEPGAPPRGGAAAGPTSQGSQSTLGQYKSVLNDLSYTPLNPVWGPTMGKRLYDKIFG